jgi:phosphate:Na+ symporter
VGLLLLGLIHMKAGAHPLKEVGWFTAFLAYTRTSFLVALVAGGFLSFVAQSSTTVSVVAISMAKVGLLGWEQTIMIVYGANVGSGLSTTFMASNVRGVARQLAWFQAVFKLAGALVLVPLFYVEVLAGVPLAFALVSRFADDLGHQMAFIFLLYQVVCALVVLSLSGAILRLVERLSPPTREEVLARPQFIYDQALEEPETALELVAREQLRMARHLPDYLDTVREETRATAKLTPARLHHAVAAVLKQVDSFTTDLLDQGHSRGSLERAVRLKNRNQQLLALDESLLALVELVPDSRRSAALQTLAGRMTEALHTVLLTALDALETPDEFNRETLQTLTADRGELMERIRKAMLSGDRGLGAEDQQTLFALTSLFERVIWLLRRLGATLEPAGGGVTSEK